MVKFASFVFVAGMLAASAAASSGAIDIESRDAAEYEELFSRCKIVDGKAIGACKKGRTYRRELDVDEIEELSNLRKAIGHCKKVRTYSRELDVDEIEELPNLRKAIGHCRRVRTYSGELDVDENEERSFVELDEFTARDLEPLSDAEELSTRCKGCKRGHTPRELDVDEIEAREFYARDIQEYGELTARDLEPSSYAEELFARCKIVNGKATGSGCKAVRAPRPRELDVNEIEARGLQEFDELTARDVELLGHVKDLLSRYYEDLEMRTPEKDGKIYA